MQKIATGYIILFGFLRHFVVVVEGSCNDCRCVSPPHYCCLNPAAEKLYGTVEEIFDSVSQLLLQQELLLCGIKMTMEDGGQRHWTSLPGADTAWQNTASLELADTLRRWPAVLLLRPPELSLHCQILVSWVRGQGSLWRVCSLCLLPFRQGGCCHFYSGNTVLPVH